MSAVHTEGNGKAVDAGGLRGSGEEGGARHEQDDVSDSLRVAVERARAWNAITPQLLPEINKMLRFRCK